MPPRVFMSETADVQATLHLPEEVPTTGRAQLRIVSVHESETQKSSVEGTQYSFICVDRLVFRSELHSTDDSEMQTAAFFRTTARPAGLTSRYNCSRQHLNSATGGPVEAILKSDFCETRSAVVRNWRPITNLEWQSTLRNANWAKGYTNRNFPRAHSLASYPVTLEDTAEFPGKYVRKGDKKTPQPPPPPQIDPDDEEDQADYHTSWDGQVSGHQWEAEWGKPADPRERVQLAGQWYRKRN